MQLYYPTSTDVEEEASSVDIRCSEGKIVSNTSQTGMEAAIPGNSAICEEERSFALYFFLYMTADGERFLFPVFFFSITLLTRAQLPYASLHCFSYFYSSPFHS